MLKVIISTYHGEKKLNSTKVRY